MILRAKVMENLQMCSRFQFDSLKQVGIWIQQKVNNYPSMILPPTTKNLKFANI